MSSPYLNARTEWLERYGSYIARSRKWRITAWVALGIAALSLTGNLIQMSQSKVVPYVVEVDRIGRVSAVQRAEEAAPYTDKILKAALADFVRQWRTVTVDMGLQNHMVDYVSAHAIGAAWGVLQDWYGENNPGERARKTLVDISISGVPQPVSEESWRVEWVENVRNHDGVLLSTHRYQATLSVTVTPPKTEEQILINPAGIYVTGLTWGKVLSR